MAPHKLLYEGRQGRKIGEDKWHLHRCSSPLSPQWSVKSHTRSEGKETPLLHWKAWTPCWPSGEIERQTVQRKHKRPSIGKADMDTAASGRNIPWHWDARSVTYKMSAHHWKPFPSLFVFQIRLLLSVHSSSSDSILNRCLSRHWLNLWEERLWKIFNLSNCTTSEASWTWLFITLCIVLWPCYLLKEKSKTKSKYTN